MKTFITFLGLTLLTFCGCMHTVIGGRGDVSPDQHYELSITSHGASGKAYVDTSKKRVYLRISDLTGLTDSFHKDYKFFAAGLHWRVDWRTTNVVAVEFFDFGDKISEYDDRARQMPSNHIATVTFQRDPVTGMLSVTK